MPVTGATLRVILAVAALAPSGLPLVAQDQPVPELPGMGRPIDLQATAARRQRLLDRLGPALVLIPAAPPRDVEAVYVQDNDFRQHNTFFYLTELESPDAWLLLAADPEGTRRVGLFLPRREPMRERWTGIKLGPDSTAVRLTGIASVLPLESLDSAVRAERARGRSTVYLPLDVTTRRDERVLGWMFEDGLDVRNLRPVADSMRLVKDAREIERLRRAVDITIEGHLAALAAARPGLGEYQLEAVIEGTFRRLGADRLGFPSIVGSGPNSTVLHYDVNRRRMEAGDLVVIDIGAEYGQYTADVTRTVPVSGRFNERQRAVYDLVLGAQQAAIDSVRPGTTIARLDQIAREYLRTNSGTVCGNVTCDRYFIHGLSHWLGMDVHDVGPYRVPLEPGMVLTVEPGIYLPAEGLGVRIEDDVLVTAGGRELLSAKAPRRAEEIERAMRQR